MADNFEGEFFTDKTGPKIFVYKCNDICFYDFVKNTPLYGKTLLKSEKKYFPNISPQFLDAAGGQISDL